MPNAQQTPFFIPFKGVSLPLGANIFCVDDSDLELATKTLSGNGFKLWIKFVSMTQLAKYCDVVASQEDFQKEYGLTPEEYSDALNELKACGYLVWDDAMDCYIFNECPNKNAFFNIIT